MNEQERRRAEASLEQEKVKAMQALTAIAIRRTKIEIGSDLPNPIIFALEGEIEKRVNGWDETVKGALEAVPGIEGSLAALIGSVKSAEGVGA